MFHFVETVNGLCEFSKCWFRHDETPKNSNSKGASTENTSPGLDFQKGSNQMEPPEMAEMKEILEKAMTMIISVNKKIENMIN